jgi:hypothetical protein
MGRPGLPKMIGSEHVQLPLDFFRQPVFPSIECLGEAEPNERPRVDPRRIARDLPSSL